MKKSKGYIIAGTTGLVVGILVTIILLSGKLPSSIGKLFVYTIGFPTAIAGNMFRVSGCAHFGCWGYAFPVAWIMYILSGILIYFIYTKIKRH